MNYSTGELSSEYKRERDKTRKMEERLQELAFKAQEKRELAVEEARNAGELAQQKEITRRKGIASPLSHAQIKNLGVEKEMAEDVRTKEKLRNATPEEKLRREGIVKRPFAAPTKITESVSRRPRVSRQETNISLVGPKVSNLRTASPASPTFTTGRNKGEEIPEYLRGMLKGKSPKYNFSEMLKGITQFKKIGLKKYLPKGL